MKAREFRRQRRLVSFYLSAHTTLAQRFRRRQRCLMIAILVLSVVAGTLAFTDDAERLNVLGLEASLPVWAGVLSTVAFSLALIDLVLGRDRQTGAHEDAARRLDPLAAVYRSFTVGEDDDEVDTGGLDVSGEYWGVFDSIERIPNRYFARLKAQHERRIAVSQALDKTPGAPIWLIRLKLMTADTLRLLHHPVDPSPDPPPEEAFPPDEEPRQAEGSGSSG